MGWHPVRIVAPSVFMPAAFAHEASCFGRVVVYGFEYFGMTAHDTDAVDEDILPFQ